MRAYQTRPGQHLPRVCAAGARRRISLGYGCKPEPPLTVLSRSITPACWPAGMNTGGTAVQQWFAGGLRWPNSSAAFPHLLPLPSGYWRSSRTPQGPCPQQGTPGLLGHAALARWPVCALCVPVGWTHLVGWVSAVRDLRYVATVPRLLEPATHVVCTESRPLGRSGRVGPGRSRIRHHPRRPHTTCCSRQRHY